MSERLLEQTNRCYSHLLILTYLVTTFYGILSFQSLLFPSDINDIHPQIRHNSYSSNITNSSKPLFVLHAGPPKTGTTSIQCSLPLLTPKLKKDKFIFVGKVTDCANTFSKNGYVNPRTVARCINRYGKDCGTGSDAIQCLIRKGGPCKSVQQFYSILTSAHFNGVNVIYSSEGMFDDFEFTPHFKMLLQDFHVKVVVVYRRYYQWLASRYNSLSKPVISRNDRKELNPWPSQNGKTIATLQQVMDENYHERNRKINLSGDTWDFKKKYEEHFPDTSVISMYDEGGILKTFICSFLNARKSCKVVDTVSDTLKNPSVPLHPDRMAVAAFEKGLIKKKTLTRDFVRQKILMKERSLGYRSFTDYPLVCLDSENESKILQQSLLEEKLMFTNSSSDEWEDHELLIRKEFNDYLSKGKFCNVDVDKALKDQRWIDFFSNLK